LGPKCLRAQFVLVRRSSFSNVPSNVSPERYPNGRRFSFEIARITAVRRLQPTRAEGLKAKLHSDGGYDAASKREKNEVLTARSYKEIDSWSEFLDYKLAVRLLRCHLTGHCCETGDDAVIGVQFIGTP
jgi:hypothetical protein